ncbi:MAG: hypothetical protein HC841_03865 [Verrucomicrobiae bacterium]|nr:hypothetical protein [Verrucomicrobiae bacterium]
MLDAGLEAPLFTGLERTQVGPRTRWFSDRGCIVEDGDERQVFVGGVLVGSFEVGDGFARDVLLVNLLSNGGQHVGRLARAFEIAESTVGYVRRRHAEGGLQALVRRPSKPPISKPRLGPKQCRSLERQFEKGKRVSDVLEYADLKLGIKRSTVYGIWRQWRARKSVEERTKADVETVEIQPVGQVELDMSLVAVEIEGPTLTEAPAPTDPSTEADEGEGLLEHASLGEQAPDDDEQPLELGVELTMETADASAPGGEAERPESAEQRVELVDAPLETGTTHHVQHVGSWLMLAELMRLGLYDVIARLASTQRAPVTGLRVVLDALAIALTLRERCVEGVRRIATPTSNVLLRTETAPSPQWVRKVLGQVATSCATIQDAMTKRYLAAAAAKDVAIFYIDNHMRPYTGKHTVRRGWRMQDKRVLPGTSDYYVHNVDGRAVFRVTEPSHGHLTDFLRPLADKLRRALGEVAQVVLAFDRGGAYPEMMAELRDAGIDFVTYERRPYPTLSPALFEPERAVQIKDEVYTVYEHRLKNLGKGRGRVRRVAVLTPKGTQINLLAISDLPAESCSRSCSAAGGRRTASSTATSAGASTTSMVGPRSATRPTP